MTDTPSPDLTATPREGAPPPNHHASHPGFSGLGGLVAALSFLSGRTHAARLAIELAELSELPAGVRLVDVGCGPGVAAQLANAAGAQVIGVDPAAVMLRVARTRWRTREGLEWRRGAAEDLPVDDGWARVVWSLSTVHHWHDVDRSLAEARRVLAPGGRLVVTERRIADPRAQGAAGHGWRHEQAEAFAALCAHHGFTPGTVREHLGQGNVLSVTADAH